MNNVIEEEKEIRIPMFELIKPSISKDSYLGWSFQKWVSKNINIRIELWMWDGQATPMWAFMFRNKTGDTIAKIKLKATSDCIEKNYMVGIKWLAEKSKEIAEEMSAVESRITMVS